LYPTRCLHYTSFPKKSPAYTHIHPEDGNCNVGRNVGRGYPRKQWVHFNVHNTNSEELVTTYISYLLTVPKFRRSDSVFYYFDNLIFIA
jgi:hypothetical protein